MAIKPADMENCDPKSRCLSGPNKGLAYSPADPCAGGLQFNPRTCDCEQTGNCSAPPCAATIRWKVSFATFTGDCIPRTTLCSAFGGEPYSTTITDLANGGQVEFTTVPSGGIGTCSGTQSTTAAIVYPACNEGGVYFKTVVISAPGCSVNTSSGAIATIYDQSIEYTPCPTEARWSGYSYHSFSGDSFFWTTGWHSTTKKWRWAGAPEGFAGIFSPIGDQPFGFSDSITVDATGSCSGSTAGCNLRRYDENGAFEQVYPVATVYCQCPVGYSGSFSPGCASIGQWEFR